MLYLFENHHNKKNTNTDPCVNVQKEADSRVFRGPYTIEKEALIYISERIYCAANLNQM